MKLLTLILWFGFASMGSAQSASVTSGEHDGFSRLVVTFSKPVDWTLARTEAGYTLSTKEIIPRYDLSDAFRRLTSKRIAKLQRDPAAGSLILTLECNCYAIPFELRSGVLVIDIKDGRAPEGSSFEFALDGKQLPPLSKSKIGPDKTIAKPVAQHIIGQPPLPETFTSAINSAARIPSTNSIVLPTTAALEEVRDKLLWQLGKGVTTGVVDIADSISHKSREPSISQNSTNIRVGQDLGIEANTGEPTANHMTGNGKTCLSNEELDISAWATEANVSSTFSQNTTGLVGEFDRPVPANITRAVKYLLALGFGAEGRALLTRKIHEVMVRVA